MTDLNLMRTRAAVAFWDAQQPVFDALIEDAQTNEDIFTWERALVAAKLQVGQAFFEDTKDRNSPNCIPLINPDDPWLRQLLAKYG